VPQLDRYLVTSEIFWFLVFFIVSFFLVYYFLKLIFEGSRLRSLFILGKTQQILKLKIEHYLSSGPILRTMENLLLQTTQLQKDINIRSKQILIRDRLVRNRNSFARWTILTPTVVFLHLKKLSVHFLFEIDSNKIDFE
jgi:hypothetical protein